MAASNDTTIATSNKRKLTDRTLQALKPAAPGKRYTIWDTDTTANGLGVRVSERGVKSFMIMRRLKGARNPVRVTLGTYPEMSLAQARGAAAEARRDLKLGVHPLRKREEADRAKKEADEQARREEARLRKDTFEAVAAQYFTAKLSKMRSGKFIEGIIRRELIPRWGQMPVTSITRRHVSAMLHELIADDGKRRGGEVSYAAHHARAAASALFRWAIAQDRFDGLEHNPVANVSAAHIIGSKVQRDRVLDDAEIRTFWQATGTLPYPWQQLPRLLLLTGCRLREVANAQWREFDLDKAEWTIPAERMKGKPGKRLPHLIPLSGLMLDIIKSLPRFTGGDCLFSTTGGRQPVRGLARFKITVDAAMRKASVGEDISRWVFHDLRRTARTRFSQLTIPSEVAEAMVAHVAGGVRGIYDRHKYLDEKRDGFERWARLLASIVDPPPANVVPIRKAQ